MGDRLTTIDMGQKLGVVPLFREGSWAPSNTMLPGPRPTSVPSGILIHPAFGHNRHVPKIGGGCAPFGGELGPYLTQHGRGGPMPTCLPRFILIRTTIWPQYANATDRPDMTDNGPIAWGKPFYKRSPKKPIILCPKGWLLEQAVEEN